MITKPRFKRSFEVHIVGPKHVFLLNEHDYFVLEGEVYPLVVPLIDGNHTTSEIATIVGSKVSLQKVIYALHVLEHKGFVVEGEESEPSLPTASAAFWEYLDIPSTVAAQRLTGARVAIRAVGEVSADPLKAALALLGIQSDDEADFMVVVTDDYLCKGLAEINQQALDARRPWMVVKPVGMVLWMGPVFHPQHTGCWRCLSQRLRFNRQVESYVARQKEDFEYLSMPAAMLPSTLQTGMHLTAIEIARALVQPEHHRLTGKMVTLDLLTLESQEHVLVKRPQCPVCGDPARRSPQPVELQSRGVRYKADGGHRWLLPQETFDRFNHHISPLIGAVTFVSQLMGDENGLAYAYLAGHNFAMGIESILFLRDTLRGQSGGKGTTDLQAKTSALCEALERYSGVWWRDEYVVTSSYSDLKPEAIHPNECMAFSETQYEHREKWNETTAKYHVVPQPFDENLEIDWSPIWSLTHQRFRYIPTAYCYFGHLDFLKLYFCSADSNGNAAGNTLEEAILQGLMEVVERDSVAIWWYNRIKRPAVDMDSFDLPYLRNLKRYYTTINRDLWALDITADLGIPTFAAVSRRTDCPVEDVLVGFGAHLDPNVALLRAVTEVNQFLPGLIGKKEDGTTDYIFPDQGAIEWWKAATIENQPYLVPDSTLPVRRRQDYPSIDSDDLKQDVEWCVATLQDHGLEVLVLDQTRPDIGLNVIKVIVPGLRHFWRRLGPGRLYDVPVKLGWLDKPLPEEKLNPWSVFF